MSDPTPSSLTEGADHAAPANSLLSNLPFRTVLQGLATDVLVALAFVIYETVSSDNVDWRLLGITLLKTVLMTVASYVMKKAKPPTTPPG